MPQKGKKKNQEKVFLHLLGCTLANFTIQEAIKHRRGGERGEKDGERKERNNRTVLS